MSKGLEGQQNNPEMKVRGLHPGMQKAVENLRLSAKVGLYPDVSSFSSATKLGLSLDGPAFFDKS